MRPSSALQTYREQIRTIVLNHRATNARVFGSVLRGEDTDISDLDLLVDPTPDTSMMDIGAIRHELKILLGLNVDVLTPRALPDSFRDQVLKEAVPL
ncbi:TPA: nucleotidyltransferase [Candidatus Poribacteria bacterium]|nr:nucleotidyltransferase [Candidatus Poribacteria bacterium]HIC49718.1 nucleotidyltransferase [Dehalococcoidia bacterium]HIA68593.1 nucleotidyltransferase [Candidatus Poribacteria bacterium]HIB92411.1 nucleotidyltransferase [Candidatus Poribacteria bacterium]HIC00552.1 nucleotidyltransferase [Candidatus Poribacteria bacterium]